MPQSQGRHFCRMFLWKVLVLAAALMAALSNGEATSNLQESELDKKSAKQVLVRHKRGFLWICWFGECEEERETKRERDRESNERQQESRRRRECPTKCWNPWPTTWGTCTHQCGGGGVRWQTRTIKSAAALGECKDYGNPTTCPGPSSRSQACNRFCRNGGTPNSRGCSCPVGYRGTCCETRITCGPCPTLRNGLVTPSGCNFHSGTVVRFSCNTGYRLVGSSTSTCTTAGTWSIGFPTCTAITCTALSPPSHGRLVLASGSGNSYGTTMRTTCESGYRMQGSSIRTCQANGRWSGAAPICQLVYCPTLSPPANGSLSYTNRTVGGEAVYACLRGFVLQGYNRRRCQSDSTWTGLTPTCNAITCRNLPAPANGQVTHSGSSGGKTAFGAKATFTCDRGFVRQGPSSLTCGGSDIVGSFNGQPPRCVPVDCGDPGNPDFGVRYGSNFQLGGNLTFNCGPGYFLQGETKITCLDTGRWSHPKPVCKVCGVNFYKPQMDNAKSCMACPRFSSTGSVQGATVVTQCRCRRGYKGPFGGPCSLIQCPSLQAPVHGSIISCGNKLDETCIFACDNGHVVSQGDTNRTCTDLETWTGGEVKCEPCPKNSYRATETSCLPCPANSGTTGVGNEKSGCLCNNGYRGSPGGPCIDTNECSTNNGGCEQTCVNRPGDYTCECSNAGSIKDLDDFKKCVAKNQCPEMSKPANGGAVCYSQRKTNTERCYVKCNKGFEHLDTPNAFEECGPSTKWKWSFEINSKPIPDCIPAFFEGIGIEAEVHYFTANCDNITETQKTKIAQEFIAFLSGKGICQLSNGGTCSIGDVDISCGDRVPSFFKRRKRDTRKEVIIRFKLRSEGKPLPTDKECDMDCKVEMKNRTQKLILDEAKAISDLFKQSRENNNTVILSGIEMRLTGQVTVSQSAPYCGKGKKLKNGACVTVSCGLPKTPINGGMKVSGHLYTNVTRFNCSQYYTLKGDNSTKCQANGEWSAYNTSCVHYKDLQYDCTNSNPCNPLRVPNRYYYRHTDGDKFIHCSAGGICNEKNCPSPLLWSNRLMVCAFRL